MNECDRQQWKCFQPDCAGLSSNGETRGCPDIIVAGKVKYLWGENRVLIMIKESK